jgi:hypothetical protein
MSAPSAPAPATAAAAAATQITKTRKPKCTFMLHDPKDLSSLGKYQSTDFRYAALKVASRGHKAILLRKTNTKEMREFTGDVVPLDAPKEIHRGDRVIKYTKKPVVKFVKKWVYAGAVDDDEVDTPDAPLAGVK